MAPKRRAGKEAATSATEGPPPPSVIERPIVGRDFSLLLRDFHLFLKPISGYFMMNFLGDLIPLNFSTENLGTERFLLQASV